jgi:hypothetical protein
LQVPAAVAVEFPPLNIVTKHPSPPGEPYVRPNPQLTPPVMKPGAGPTEDATTVVLEVEEPCWFGAVVIGLLK